MRLFVNPPVLQPQQRASAILSLSIQNSSQRLGVMLAKYKKRVLGTKQQKRRVSGDVIISGVANSLFFWPIISLSLAFWPQTQYTEEFCLRKIENGRASNTLMLFIRARRESLFWHLRCGWTPCLFIICSPLSVSLSWYALLGASRALAPPAALHKHRPCASLDFFLLAPPAIAAV